MITNCGCSRIANPGGIWEYYQLIGAKVKIKSMPVSNFFCNQGSTEGTISNIYFRISIDGKSVTVYELAEFPGKVFTSKDLMITEIVNAVKVYPICGAFVCGTAICGLDVDKSPSYTDKIIGGGIVIVDDYGNIISNRKVRFVGANVEDVSTDPDDVTDVSIDKINGGTF